MGTEREALFSRKASEWLKGLAIIMVILSHFAEWWTWFHTLEKTAETIRLGISKFGPYGVAIFFLFSGYGLAKSAGDKRIGFRFIVKRVTAVYIPYLIMVLLIELLSDSLHTMEDFTSVLFGGDFWYMTVLFLFYAAFIVFWLLFANRHIRAVGMVAFTILMSNQMYVLEKQDFWYLSNPAFAIGVLLALYEPVLVKIPEKVNYILAAVFGLGSGWVVYSGLYVEHIWEVPAAKMRSEMLAVLVFTMFIVFLAASWKWYDVVLRFIGKYSLYFYLSHTFIFMWVINNVAYEEMWKRFALAAAAILAVSLVIGMLVSWLMKGVNKLVDAVCRGR